MNINEKKPILHVCLSQLCYIVPVILALNKYFDIFLYFILEKSVFKSSLNLLELNRIKFEIKNIEIFTPDQYINFLNSKLPNKELMIIPNNNLINSNLESLNLENLDQLHKLKLTLGHGVDEETIIMGKKHNKAKSELFLNACLYSHIYKKMINDIYNLDPNKKTIVIFETTSLWIFKRFSSNEKKIIEYQNNIVDILIDLKKKYNIILRSHPQDYYEYFNSGKVLCCDKIKENFKIDYIPIPVFNFYEIGDIIISSRFSSSGYQALFVKNKNYIILEHDFDSRKLCSTDIFLNTHSNTKIEELKKNNVIANSFITPILYENNFDQIYVLLDNIEKQIDSYEQNKDEFTKNIFNIEREFFENMINSNYLNDYVKERLDELNELK